MPEKALKTFTVDCETDFGGRTEGITGIQKGLPLILRAFRDRGIKALFFISSELLTRCKKDLNNITYEGHEIGSHGHFHMVYKEKWRREADEKLSRFLLSTQFNVPIDMPFRAPKFNFTTDDPYSKPDNHVGLLKYFWLSPYIPENPIFYIHPFDIVGGNNPPNLFCKFWYSKPRSAYATFIDLLERYK